MESSFVRRHVTCGYGQRPSIELVHKESYEVPTCLCLSESSVHVLAGSVASIAEIVAERHEIVAAAGRHRDCERCHQQENCALDHHGER